MQHSYFWSFGSDLQCAYSLSYPKRLDSRLYLLINNLWYILSVLELDPVRNCICLFEFCLTLQNANLRLAAWITASLAMNRPLLIVINDHATSSLQRKYSTKRKLNLHGSPRRQVKHKIHYLETFYCALSDNL